MKNIDVEYLAGQPIQEVEACQPFDEVVCQFFAELSSRIRKDKEALAYPDVLSFGFYCRKGNIELLKKRTDIREKRIGRGVAFHIAPSNVPVNFAFTYLFGMLSGNANIVRISSKAFPQVSIICRLLNELFEEEVYRKIQKRTAIIRYDRNKDITDVLSMMSNVRVIWGGDNTITEIRKSPIKSRCTEITFADRYSIGMIDVEAVLAADEKELAALADNLYNDTYLMDQNACSTPHMIFWKSNGKDYEYEMAQKRFWNAVYLSAQKYDLQDIKISDKYIALCKAGIDDANIASVEQYTNYLYVLNILRMPENITSLRGKYGMFYQLKINDIAELVPVIDETIQTCVTFGVEPDEIRDMVISKGLSGIDRVVPVGKSLDIGIIWDGYDMIRQMSRIIA